MTTRWWSQRFPPEGSAASEGIRRQLGTPRLDPLAVLVREAAQNSSDARSGDHPVDFSIFLRRLDPDARRRWSDALLPEPADGGSLGLAACLADESSVMLTVSDRNTTGLGGPLRADEVGDDPDFVNLVRNIGEPRDKEFGGGTYGFGKGILFTTSTAGVILVRSRCLWQGRIQTRLIGVALGHSFQAEGVPYTGRHWWGTTGGDGVVDPLLDDEADQAAHVLGLPPFEGPEFRGTDIVILGANLGRRLGEADEEHPRSVEEAAEYIASAMLWNLWPLLSAADGARPAMTCRVVTDTRTLEIPDPVTVPRLWPFVTALRAIDAGDAKNIVRRQPTQLTTGSFFAVTSVSPNRRDWRDTAAPFIGPARHCALMRQAGLVVTYLEGPALPDDDQHYGAVFRSSRDADESFASAEPPTHDAWVTDGLPELDRRTVETAVRGIRSRLADIAAVATEGTNTVATQPPLGHLAQRLGHLVAPTAVSQPDGTNPSKSGRAGRGRRPAASFIQPPLLTLLDGEPLVVAMVEVADSAETLWLTAEAVVALDVGNEAEPPTGAASPHVVEMQSDDVRVPGGRVRIRPSDPRRWTILVKPVTDAATQVSVHVSPVGDNA
ncbi:hypothetical protein QLQ12_11580 [Actinoplanes sp. NEAU-A12]|uniref:ATP-binding protein n=1 Tax=Actinoplanes sandaracinus TaxID=3045177 RepID=A0ABT6WHP3_9ACTN|nr:hypothetical protein [Actinoplanes sandaracinus]MDI6099235.1 hypothetical protein [Actinoplanes sandaracinus]